jgi:RNA polymerase sigma factor (TIGR02999 family)
MNELYLRLIDQRRPVQWEGRSHFFGIAARLMRHILVDYARAHSAVKRTTEAAQMSLEDVVALPASHIEEILEIDDALRRLAETDERKAKVVELRYFGGMTHEEIAAACGLSVRTVKRDLNFSEAWLRRDLRHKRPGGKHGSRPVESD